MDNNNNNQGQGDNNSNNGYNGVLKPGEQVIYELLVYGLSVNDENYTDAYSEEYLTATAINQYGRLVTKFELSYQSAITRFPRLKTYTLLCALLNQTMKTITKNESCVLAGALVDDLYAEEMGTE